MESNKQSRLELANCNLIMAKCCKGNQKKILESCTQSDFNSGEETECKYDSEQNNIID